MQLTAFISQIKPRAQRLGLVDPVTGYVDEDELAVYTANACRYLANRYQLQHFLKMNRELFLTEDGIESYSLPDGYGFWSPEDDRRSGFAVSDSDGTNTVDLTYYDPMRFNLERTTNESKPAWFTLIDSLMYLNPIPDTTYIIEAISRPVQDGEQIPEPYVAAVQSEILWRLASDMGKATATLGEERTQILMRTANDEKRLQQNFYRSSRQIGQSHR